MEGRDNPREKIRIDERKKLFDKFVIPPNIKKVVNQNLLFSF